MLFRPSRTKWLRLMLVCLAFVAVGISVLSASAVGGWLCIVFFGLGVIVCLVALLPGSGYLKLTSSGFEYASMYRRFYRNWSDVETFYVWTVPTAFRVQMVKFQARSHALDRENAAQSRPTDPGTDIALPDTYGMAAQSLANLLNGWLERNRGN